MGAPRRENPKPNNSHAQAQAAEALLQRQIQLLSQLHCLRDIPEAELRLLARVCVFRAFSPGTILFDERRASEHLYIICRGKVSLRLHNRQGQQVVIGELSEGDCFGEAPLFGDLLRRTSVTTDTICYILQVPLRILGDLLPQIPQLVSALRMIYTHRSVVNTLGRVPLFSQLPLRDRVELTRLLRPQFFDRGEFIIREGGRDNGLFLIESGQVVAEHQGQVIAHLEEGMFFGEMSLLEAKPHSSDIRTITPTNVFCLAADDFLRLLDEQPNLAAQLNEVVERRRLSASAMHQDPVRSHQYTTAISHGLLRGKYMLARDMSLCDDTCHLCEEACASRHGHQRLYSEGLIIQGLDMMNACRQCRFAAECVEACPEQAIQVNDQGILIITDDCNGCSACVTACPYNAVQMKAITKDKPTPLQTLLDRLRHGGRTTIPLQGTVQQRADKCDLCHGYDDLACVSACPNNALRLVPVEELFPL
jgi:CRP-like cAMP-binding protein/Fe-S-cluster-containing hydrogenase component 2